MNKAPAEYENLSIEEARRLTIPADEWFAESEPDYEAIWDARQDANEAAWDMRWENAAW